MAVFAQLDDRSKPYWTKQRRELAAWFEDRVPSFTEGYVASVRLLHENFFPARIHLVCHVVRDIYRRLPGSLGYSNTSRPTEVFPNMVKALVKKWEEYPPPGNVDTDGASSGIQVSRQVFRYVEKIIEKSNEMASQPSVGNHLAIALFRSIDRRDDEFIPPWVIDAFNAEYDFFVARAHLVLEMKKVPDDDGLIENFEKFERAFHSLVGPYFSGKEELDDILQSTNTTTD